MTITAVVAQPGKLTALVGPSLAHCGASALPSCDGAS
jgi:hypothetical protein